MPSPSSDPTREAADLLAPALARHLPPAPAWIGVMAGSAGGEGPGAAEVLARELARRLEAAGNRWTWCPTPGPSSQEAEPPADDPFDALLWIGDSAVPAESLPGLRQLLAPRGRLFLITGVADPVASTMPVIPPDDERWEVGRQRTRALYESGFVILDEVAARPMPATEPEEPDGPPLFGDGARGVGPHLTVARRSRHRVRSYQPGDETAILALFQRVFHQRRSLAQWRWRYVDNPYANHRISLAVDEDGELAVHYAGYPVRLWAAAGVLGGVATSATDGQLLDALHVGDTMTSPEARRVGRGRTNLLSRAVNHFYSAYSRGRVAFNYGANVGKIQRFYRRAAGGRWLEEAPHCSRPLDGHPFPGTPGRLATRLAGWRVERIAALPDGDGDGDGDDQFPGQVHSQGHRLAVERRAADLDDLWRRSRAAYRLLLERDHRYLAWRYAAPEIPYHLWAVYRRRRLVGWSVFRYESRGVTGEADERLVWGDALFDPEEPEAPAVLLTAATAAPELQGARRIEGWLTDRPAWWGRTVARLGFERQPEPQDLGVIYAHFLLNLGDVLAQDWYYTKADTDLF